MQPAEYDVTGKVVFITGAGRGIGKGIAQVLAEAGADVAINALTPKYVESTAAEVAKATGRRVISVPADVTKTDGVRRAIDAVMKEFDRIDVLINNLGDAIRKPLVALPGRADAATALSDDELKFVMDINLTEAVLCTRAVGPQMLDRRSGKVSTFPPGRRVRGAVRWWSIRSPRRHWSGSRGPRRWNGRPMAFRSMPSPLVFSPMR